MFRKKGAKPSTTTFLLMMAAVLPLMALHTALAAEDPVPREIKTLSIGADRASLMDMISGAGTIASESPQEKRRPKITWQPLANTFYQDIEFSFTEKDRLYLIRYNLKEVPRQEFQNLKKTFFDLYKFSWEEPMRFKVRESDVLLYQPEKGNTFFLEFTDKKTGLKSIELFDKRVSAQDRAPAKAQENGKESADTKTAPEPEKPKNTE
ncbi:MAG TPA: hypothetical protein VK463_07155 [Desulfomonilaceae bacterium]|nr:hypothetical protein [Desulfomonilaceae bacterium]